jgi:hypothetical protein
MLVLQCEHITLGSFVLLLLVLPSQASLAEQYANEEADLQSQTADVAALAAELAASWFWHSCNVPFLYCQGLLIAPSCYTQNHAIDWMAAACASCIAGLLGQAICRRRG